MSYPHFPAPKGAGVGAFSPKFPAIQADKRPAKPAALTRRYEISWLDASGNIETSTRLGPATARFEEAFSAFARGTLIATSEGPVAIEDMVPGMLVQTAEGRMEKVVWIGSMTVYPSRTIPGMEPAAMTRITAEALGVGRPMPDLMLGPQARILVRDARCRAAIGAEAAYAPARTFIDGDCVVEVTPAAPLSVYHLMLSRHASVRAAGMDVESYHPGKGAFEGIEAPLAPLFLALFPNVRGFQDFGPMTHPRLGDDALDLLSAA
jgi:hypothetical protein